MGKSRKLASDATWKKFHHVVAMALIIFANLLYIGVDIDDWKPKQRLRILVESEWKDDVDRVLFTHAGMDTFHTSMFSATATLRKLLDMPVPKELQGSTPQELLDQGPQGSTTKEAREEGHDEDTSPKTTKTKDIKQGRDYTKNE